MAGSRFPESMNALTDYVVAGLKRRLDDAVDDVEVRESRDSPTPWLTLECTLFDYLPVVFTYDRGFCGFGVDFGSRGTPLAPREPLAVRSAQNIDVLLDQAVEQARLRIPDKFLESRGWA